MAHGATPLQLGRADVLVLLPRAHGGLPGERPDDEREQQRPGDPGTAAHRSPNAAHVTGKATSDASIWKLARSTGRILTGGCGQLHGAEREAR